MKKLNVLRKSASALAMLIIVAAVASVISFSAFAHSTTDLTPSRITPGSSLEVSVERTIFSRGDGEMIFFNVTNISSYSVDLWRIEIPLDRPAKLVQTWWHEDVEIWIRNETTLVIRGRYSIGVDSGYRGGFTIEYLDCAPQSIDVNWSDDDSFMMRAQSFEDNLLQYNRFPFTFEYAGEHITLNNPEELSKLVLFRIPVDFVYRGETYRVRSSYTLPFDLTEVFVVINNEAFSFDYTAEENIVFVPLTGHTDLPELVRLDNLSVEEYLEREEQKRQQRQAIDDVMRQIDEMLGLG